MDDYIFNISRQIVDRRFENGFYNYIYKLKYKNIDLEKEKPFCNIGPGSFRHPYWTNIDRRYEGSGWTEVRRHGYDNKPDVEWNFMEHKEIRHLDNKFYIVYLSHVIEHGYNNDILFLLTQIYKILKPGGLLRIVCPDADIYKHMFINDDYFAIYNYLCLKKKRMHFNRIFKNYKRDAVFFIIDNFSLCRNINNDVYIDLLDMSYSYLDKNKFYKSLDNLYLNSSRELQLKIAAHVNWFNYEKIKYFLEISGFKNINKSGYLQSNFQILTDPFYFDKTDKELSLFVEAST